MISTHELGEEIIAYETAFNDFCNGYDLPKEWFKRPDHFAIKCADADDYQQTVAFLGKELVKPESLWEITMDQRKLASAQLASRVSLGDFRFEWIEFMQPRPGKELEKGFVEHTEFVFPDFFEVKRVLHQRGVGADQYEEQGNEGHAWLNVVIDEAGREIKFNDKPLEQVVTEEQQAAGINVASVTPLFGETNGN